MIAQSLARAVAENLATIRTKLGKEDWLRFRQQIGPLLKQFPREVTDANVLEMATIPLWEVCQFYPFIKALVLEYSEQRQREVEAGGEGYDAEMNISETCNEYYALDAEFADYSEQSVDSSES